MSDQPVLVRRLSNGAEIRVLQQPWGERVGLCLRVAVGSHDEPPAYPGLAHFLEHLLFLGSRHYAAEQGLMAFVQGQGGVVNASTQARHTDFVFELAAEQLQPALLRLLDMLRWPLLQVEAQAREREVLQAEYQARSQDAGCRIDHALGQALAAGHRCADFLAGDRASLPLEKAVFQQALRDYHQNHYLAGRMRLTLVGPQPAEQLLAIAEEQLRQSPGCDDEPANMAPAAMLPLRAPRLSLQHSRAGLYLGCAVQLQADGLEQALELLLDALQDVAPRGLLAGLRELSLCQQLLVRVLYCHAGQCLLRFDCGGAEVTRGTELRTAIQGWLQSVQDDPNWASRLREWHQSAALRQLVASPLALAQHLQAPQCDEACTLRALKNLLAQMAADDGWIELQCSEQPQPDWPAGGLSLPLRALPACEPVVVVHRDWRLPLGDALLQVKVPAVSVLPAVRLHHYASVSAGGPAALYWRGRLDGEGAWDELEATLQARIGDIRQRGERLGIVTQLSVQRESWTLVLQGVARLLPGFSAQILPLLLAPIGQRVEPVSQGLLLRALLQRLPVLCEAPGELELQGMGVGFSEREQEQLGQFCASVEPLLALQPVSGDGGGLTWCQAAQPGGDAALLLFCPLPAVDAYTEAAWRLLGQLLQGRFYQRLRGELQLGYALFAGFRQVQGQRGLLFALQSPVCDAAGVGHIRAFLDEQRESLATLDDTLLSGCRTALQQALRPLQANLPRAEQLWQLHLAGLPEVHPQRVREALTALAPNDLLKAHEQLLRVSDWRVLASGAQPPA
jgi:coenzyme PQQ biosynthesis probable peptidase PqqF